MRKTIQNESKFVCHKCIGEKYSSNHIKEFGSRHKCSFCGQNRLSMPLVEFASFVNDALYENFRLANERPVIDPNSDHVNWELGGDLIEYTLADTLLIENDLVLALIQTLKSLEDSGEIEPAFDYSDEEIQIESFVHELSDSPYYSAQWEEFTNEAKHRGRYFNKTILRQLEAMLSGVTDFRSSKGNTAIRTINPNDSDSVLFRARQANDDNLRLRIILNPSKELGSPPPNLASPGRMNPAGVSVFYGSFELNTCISEIRLPVGGIVATVRFKLIKPVKVLDLTIFDEGPQHISYFDPDRYEKTSQMIWLEAFHREISEPVLPQDEVFNYVPTQIVSEFLATKFSPQLDGIIYSSALTNTGRNIVLFNHAAAIQLKSPRNSRITKKELVGFLENSTYWIEEKSSKEHTTVQSIDLEKFTESFIDPTLAYIPDSLEMHQVKSISLLTRPVSIINTVKLRKPTSKTKLHRQKKEK